jgi:periplasmic divalent cation tolerance protein
MESSSMTVYRSGKGEKMNEFRIALVTAEGREEAERLANIIIGAGLSPCVNILPSCLSIYQWRGRLNRDEEALMVIKMKSDEFGELVDLVEKNHSYDVPEIVSLDLAGVSEKYAAFLGDFLDK